MNWTATTLMILGLAVILVGCQSSSEAPRPKATAAAEPQSPEDSQITLMVEQKLAADKQTQGAYIQVHTKNGVVTLDGFAHRQSEKQRAEEIAKATPNVREVLNRITVSDAAGSVSAPPAGSFPSGSKKGPIDPKKPGGPRKQ